METNDRNMVSFMAISPMEIVKDELKARGISQKEFAYRIGMQPSNLSRAIKEGNISPQFAARLESALGIPSSEWMSLQAQYERDLIAIRNRDESEKEAVVREQMLCGVLNLAELYKRLRISTSEFVHRKMELISDMLGWDLMKLPEAPFMQAACYKKSDKLTIDEKNQNTWLTIAYIESRKSMPTADYTKGNAAIASKLISKRVHDGGVTEHEIREILNDNGIAYSVVEKLSKTPIDAVSMMVEGKPAIVTTHRYNDMSRLIFNVEHELGHIELHFRKDGCATFISSDESYSADGLEEREANNFAEDALIPPKTWAAMMNSRANNISSQNIVRKLRGLSIQYGLDPNIVIWRYKYESHNYQLRGTKPVPIR